MKEREKEFLSLFPSYEIDVEREEALATRLVGRHIDETKYSWELISKKTIIINLDSVFFGLIKQSKWKNTTRRAR